MLICEWKTPTEKLIGDCPVLDPDPEFEQTESGYYLDWANKAKNAGGNLIRELESQAIYFDADLYKKIMSGFNCCNDAVAKIVNHVDVGLTVGEDYDDLVPDAMKYRKELIPIFNARFQPLFDEIVAEFRKLLGSMKGNIGGL